MIRTCVFNGWAAGPETWNLCTFAHDWIFDYLEQMEGVPARVLADFDAYVLVGFSMGGANALKAMLAHPEKVRGLVLISTTPCMMERPNEGWRGMSPHRRKALHLGTRLLFADNPSPIYREENLVRGLDFLEQTDLRADLRACGPWRFPVQILQSRLDGIVRPTNADFLKSVFPQAEVTWVEGNEHVLPVARPDLVDAAVEKIKERL